MNEQSLQERDELVRAYLKLVRRIVNARYENDLLKDELEELKKDYAWLSDCYDSLIAQHYEGRYL